MDLNITKLSLGNLLLVLLTLSCINRNNDSSETLAKIKTDTCKIDQEKADALGSDISCTSCHTLAEERVSPNVFTMKEVSDMDSLKLRDFLFIIKHKKNLSLYKDAPITKQRLKKIDSLSDCDRKNLIHYIKEYNRPHLYILRTAEDTIPEK
ncbi:hypothetical protein OQX63_20460 [Pedobacter sp. PF22-3]|jgi:predicted transcriptional regulator|uniref:c-type cytochrome n=1 Tax=Pedobacter sp. PF22-3 TaxID=2994467 RepID=UPI002246CEEA|nr:c-type cytochrome [Pedobacter sp. PF22-3]MCX2495879.1 hypothetical protein [Pedobacter sp. PF22-3]